jgi:hypothetical protein
VRQLARPLAITLIAGAALLGLGASFHPVLGGKDAAAQLALMAGTSYWRTIHLVMLVGSALIIAGVWVRGIIGARDVPPLVCALVLISVGYTLNALNIAYMAGAGTHMATMFAAGRTEMASVYDATHPIGQMSARFGNLLVSIAALVLGWVERRDGRSRWGAPLAWLAAAAGLVGVLAFHESSPLALAAVATLSGWHVLTAVRALRWRDPEEIA